MTIADPALTDEVPLVSVVMITYKHEAFISKAIDGVLSQEIDSPIELIVADDCSPDRTPDIVRGFLESHPKGHRLRYHRHESNQGMIPNLVWALKQARGKYVALCDGDDYWTDPRKLRKQVEFLDANESFSICAHAVEVHDEHGTPIRTFSKPGEYSRLALLQDYPISTLSVLFRNQVCDYRIDQGVFSADLFLFMKLLQDHKAWVMPDVMGVHIEHDGGVWSRKSAEGKLVDACNTYAVLRDRVVLDSDERAFVLRRIEEFETWLAFKRTPVRGVLLGRIPVSFFAQATLNGIKGALMRLKRSVWR